MNYRVGISLYAPKCCCVFVKLKQLSVCSLLQGFCSGNHALVIGIYCFCSYRFSKHLQLHFTFSLCMWSRMTMIMNHCFVLFYTLFSSATILFVNTAYASKRWRKRNFQNELFEERRRLRAASCKSKRISLNGLCMADLSLRNNEMSKFLHGILMQTFS